MDADVLSTNNRQLILDALKSGDRLDGRKFAELRRVDLRFDHGWGECSVEWGRTQVLAVVSGEVVEPFEDRPSEGFLNIFVNFSSMSSIKYADRSDLARIDGNEASQILERALKGSRAIDTEALCILSGKQVWSLRCDVHVLNDAGNVLDACHLAALSSIVHYRRPEVTIVGEEVTVHKTEEREPVPLSIHHLPFFISFGLFLVPNSEDSCCLVDTTTVEQAVINGTMSFAVNVHNEVCSVHKTGGQSLPMDKFRECIQIAFGHAKQLNDFLKTRLSEDQEARKTKKRRDILQKIHGSEGESKRIGSEASSSKDPSSNEAKSSTPVVSSSVAEVAEDSDMSDSDSDGAESEGSYAITANS